MEPEMTLQIIITRPTDDVMWIKKRSGDRSNDDLPKFSCIYNQGLSDKGLSILSLEFARTN